MKIESLSNGCMRIWLSSGELTRFGVSVETAQGSEQCIRRLLEAVLSAAARQQGERCAPALAEVIPVDGGCVLLLTPRRRAAGGALVFCPRDLEALYALAERWRDIPCAPCTSLYELNTEYRLVVHTAGALPLRLRRLLSAYGEPLGYGAAAVAAVEEHGRPLCVGRALETLLEAPANEPYRLS